MQGFPDVLLTHEPISDAAKQLIRDTVSRMLRSVPFRTSRQCQDLLSYVVEHSLAHEEELLRERVIGVSVFGRRPDYDTAEDPVVRIRAADVRKRIALYYQSIGTETVPVRIDIPPGSYRASFEWIPSNPSGADAGIAQPDIRPAKSGLVESISSASTPLRPENKARVFRTKWAWLPAVIACLCLALLFSRLTWRSPEQTVFNRFWAPVLDSPVSTLIYVGSNAAYSLSPSFVRRYREQHNLTRTEGMGREFFIPLQPGEKLDSNDLVPVTDTYVTIGDVAASTKITSLLAVRNKRYDMRFGGDIAFGDLQQSPAILIGAFNNSWTLEMTNNLRFVFAYDHRIEDRVDKGRTWTATDGSADDYALVSRILNSKTGQVLLTAAGIGQAGTRAAGAFLTDPKAISAAVKNAPRDWDKKNMQILLHTSVVNGVPAASDIVAVYSW